MLDEPTGVGPHGHCAAHLVGRTETRRKARRWQFMAKTREHRRRNALRRHIGQFDSESLWLLLAAAGASPAVRHKWVRVGHLVDLASKTTGRSGRPADPDVLHDLLDRAAESIGNIYMYEDYLPEDPRDDVRIRISDYTLRIGPGD